MNREERESFVLRAWFGEGTPADAVKKIVDKWEEDNAEVFENGDDNGYQRALDQSLF